jgi:hypothetical protein
MKSLSRKYIVALCIVWCSTILISVGGYFLIIRPQGKAAKDVEQQLIVTEEEYLNAQQAKSEQSKIMLQKKLQDAQEMMNWVFVDSGNAAELVFQISQIAQKLGLEGFTGKRNESLSCEVLEGCKNLGQVWIDVTFSADFPQFARFINLLERHKPFVFVESFDIDRGVNKEDKPKIKMRLAFFVGKELAQSTK